GTQFGGLQQGALPPYRHFDGPLVRVGGLLLDTWKQRDDAGSSQGASMSPNLLGCSRCEGIVGYEKEKKRNYHHVSKCMQEVALPGWIKLLERAIAKSNGTLVLPKNWKHGLYYTTLG
ncbi:unnamed protein product, partial [Hapterophycus canaliculatus]